VKPPPSIMEPLASISTWPGRSERDAQRLGEQDDVGAARLRVYAMVGLAPTRAGSHHRYRRGFCARSSRCMPARCRCARPTMARRAAAQDRTRHRRMRRLVRPAERFGRDKLRFARSCILPITVVRFTLRSVRRVPAGCPAPALRRPESPRGCWQLPAAVGVA